jgi:hypothetical protein
MAETKMIIDAETGSIQEIELTKKEIDDRAISHAAFEAQIAEREAIAKAKADAKNSLTEKLGLSAEEAALLLG